MKKVLAYGIVLYYLVFIIGFSVNLHFCHGELSEVSFISQQSACGCSGSAEKMNCCRDVDKFLQLQTDPLAINKNIRTAPCIHPISFFKLFCALSPKIEFSEFIPTLVAINKGIPIYIQNQSQIFYG